MHSVHLDSAKIIYAIYRDKSGLFYVHMYTVNLPIQMLTFYSLYVTFCLHTAVVIQLICYLPYQNTLGNGAPVLFC